MPKSALPPHSHSFSINLSPSPPPKPAGCFNSFISTPNLGVKRKLKETFNVFNIDEYRTSCLHYKSEEKGDNLYITDKINKRRKLHSVLTFQYLFFGQIIFSNNSQTYFGRACQVISCMSLIWCIDSSSVWFFDT